jgi:uncharacterized membrane protein
LDKVSYLYVAHNRINRIWIFNSKVGGKMINQPRWKSKAAWVSALSLILFVAKTYFNIDIVEGDKLVDLILITLSAFGIWNNPTDKEGF